MDISNFKDNFNGGTRANRFVVYGNLGINNTTAAGTNAIKFHIRSTFIPPITNITLTHNAYGRQLNIPGDREYAPWQITVYDDTNVKSNNNNNTVSNLWTQFSQWSNNINSHSRNIPGDSLAAPHLSYKCDWQLDHLDLNGNVLKRFQLLGCWPKSVSDIDFNMSRKNFLNTFSVILLYDEIRIGLNSATPGTISTV